MDFYFDVIIDGIPTLFESGVNYNESASYASCCTSAGQEVQSCVLQSTLDSSINQGGFRMIQNFTSPPTQCSDLLSMFTLGTQSFGNGTMGVDGLIVYYIDFNGTYWASHLGTADQTGSSAELTELINSGSANSVKIATLEVNCKLYDGMGGQRELTNGIMRSYALQCDHL